LAPKKYGKRNASDEGGEKTTVWDTLGLVGSWLDTSFSHALCPAFGEIDVDEILDD